MNRLSTLLWMLVIVAAAFMVYMAKYQVQSVKTQVADTARELEHEKEALHVVAAEWAYLNRPDRLQQLAEKYLSSSDLTVDRVAEIEAIPFPAQMQAAATPEDGMVPVAAHITPEAGEGE